MYYLYSAYDTHFCFRYTEYNCRIFDLPIISILGMDTFKTLARSANKTIVIIICIIHFKIPGTQNA